MIALLILAALGAAAIWALIRQPGMFLLGLTAGVAGGLAYMAMHWMVIR